MTSAIEAAAVRPDDGAKRNVWQAIRRGFFERCPRCGVGHMFRAYLKVNDACPNCGEELSHHRADDAPPYLTMFIVGHVVLGGMLTFEVIGETVPVWMQMIFWPLAALVMSLLLLPRLKGGLIAYQWALRMHGFETEKTAASADRPW